MANYIGFNAIEGDRIGSLSSDHCKILNSNEATKTQGESLFPNNIAYFLAIDSAVPCHRPLSIRWIWHIIKHCTHDDKNKTKQEGGDVFCSLNSSYVNLLEILFNEQKHRWKRHRTFQRAKHEAVKYYSSVNQDSFLPWHIKKILMEVT